jgi:hypothetical protein
VLEPEHRRLRPEQVSDLVADGREDLHGRHASRHQRGHPPQRRLLLDEPGESRVRLGIRDRCRHQLRERAQPGLGVRGQRLLPARADAEHAPQTALDHDRRPDRRADTLLAGIGNERAGGIGVALDPGRPAGLVYERGAVLPLKL